MELNTIQKKLAVWQGKNFPQEILPIKIQHMMQMALGMNEEAGEAAHSVLKLSQKIRNGNNTRQTVDDIEDAVVDTFIYGIQLLTLIERDVESAITKVTNEIYGRDWIKFPGNGVDK